MNIFKDAESWQRGHQWKCCAVRNRSDKLWRNWPLESRYSRDDHNIELILWWLAHLQRTRTRSVPVVTPTVRTKRLR
jgi:hypothetical protein